MLHRNLSLAAPSSFRWPVIASLAVRYLSIRPDPPKIQIVPSAGVVAAASRATRAFVIGFPRPVFGGSVELAASVGAALALSRE